MASKKSPSIFGTLQKTADNAAAVNGEFVRQLRVDALEENPMNRFSMAEDAPVSGHHGQRGKGRIFRRYHRDPR